MKRALHAVLIGLITFVVGLVAASSWNMFHPMTLCELDANPKAYGGKVVRFRSIMSVGQGRIDAMSNCSPADSASASIELRANELTKLSLQDVNKFSGSKQEQVALADVIISGTLNPSFGMGCFAPKYQITNASIERVLSVHNFESIQEAVDWLKSNPQ